MAEFRCPQCGIRVFGRPGALQASCPHCGQPAEAVLAPPASPAVLGQTHRWGAGKWALIALGIFAFAGAVVGIRNLAGAGTPRVILASGRAAAIEDVPTPIRVRPIIGRAGRRVIMQFAMTDAQGIAVKGISLGTSRMPLPRITVLDEAGNVVHTGKFEYG